MNSYILAASIVPHQQLITSVGERPVTLRSLVAGFLLSVSASAGGVAHAGPDSGGTAPEIADAVSDANAPLRIRFRELTPSGFTGWMECLPGSEPSAYRHTSGIECRDSVDLTPQRAKHSITVVNTSGKPFRLLTLAVAVRVPLSGPVAWHESIYSQRPVTASDTVLSFTVAAEGVRSPDGGLNTESFGAKGAGGYGQPVGQGRMSPYPFACVSDGNSGAAIAIDIGTPVVYRLMYRAAGELVAEFDIALSDQQAGSANTARLNLCTYAIDPAWGFRSAAERYYALFPHYYQRRLKKEGIWMPFTPVSEVERVEDFGFAIFETHRETKTMFRGVQLPAWAAAESLGVATFQYTEPWDIQIPVDPAGVRYADAPRVAERTPEDGPQISRSAAYDEHGQWIARLISAPWFNPPWAISYTTSAAPDASGQSRFSHVVRREIDPALADGLDGIYFDSLEFFWHYDLDYRPEHVAASKDVLTFSAASRAPRPAVWNYASQHAMMRDVCSRLHAGGSLSMGNGYSWIPFAVSELDILGTEFSWFMPPEEKESVSAFRRTSCGQKPVVLLLNEGLYSKDFSEPPHEGYRQYFEESLLYGLYPSFFSADASNNPYWKNPDAYNVGRPFFVKYVPIIREVNSQGWQPVTLARAADPGVRIERFDRSGDGVAYFTIRNVSSGAIRDCAVTFDPDLGAAGNVEEIVHRAPVLRPRPDQVTLTLQPRTTYVLRCSTTR